jgi:nitric oxide reductase large subunit
MIFFEFALATCWLILSVYLAVQLRKIPPKKRKEEDYNLIIAGFAVTVGNFALATFHFLTR